MGSLLTESLKGGGGVTELVRRFLAPVYWLSRPVAASVANEDRV